MEDSGQVTLTHLPGRKVRDGMRSKADSAEVCALMYDYVKFKFLYMYVGNGRYA